MTFSHFQAHAPPLYKQLNILQLRDIVFLQTATFMHDYYHNNLPAAFSKYFTQASEIHPHFTRYSVHNYFLPSVATNYGKFSLKFTGLKIWNSINETTKCLSRKSFIKEIKKNCFYSYL